MERQHHGAAHDACPQNDNGAGHGNVSLLLIVGEKFVEKARVIGKIKK